MVVLAVEGVEAPDQVHHRVGHLIPRVAADRREGGEVRREGHAPVPGGLGRHVDLDLHGREVGIRGVLHVERQGVEREVIRGLQRGADRVEHRGEGVHGQGHLGHHGLEGDRGGRGAGALVLGGVTADVAGAALGTLLVVEAVHVVLWCAVPELAVEVGLTGRIAEIQGHAVTAGIFLRGPGDHVPGVRVLDDHGHRRRHLPGLEVVEVQREEHRGLHEAAILDLGVGAVILEAGHRGAGVGGRTVGRDVAAELVRHGDGHALPLAAVVVVDALGLQARAEVFGGEDPATVHVIGAVEAALLGDAFERVVALLARGAGPVAEATAAVVVAAGGAVAGGFAVFFAEEGPVALVGADEPVLAGAVALAAVLTAVGIAAGGAFAGGDAGRLLADAGVAVPTVLALAAAPAAAVVAAVEAFAGGRADVGVRHLGEGIELFGSVDLDEVFLRVRDRVLGHARARGKYGTRENQDHDGLQGQ